MTQRRRPVTVAIHDGAPFAETIEALRAAGMEIEQVLEAVGAVTGWALAEDLDRLRRIAGATVELGQTYQLPDPGSTLQ